MVAEGLRAAKRPVGQQSYPKTPKLIGGLLKSLKSHKDTIYHINYKRIANGKIE